MVQKAIVVDLCDICQPVEVNATLVIVATVNGSELAIDLCGMHAKELTIFEFVNNGRQVKESGKGKHTREKIQCEICNKWFSKGSGMALHKKTHVS